MGFALIGSIFIGASLGLLGSGGSVFTVPLLVFFLQRPEKLAIAESMAIVGSCALAGSIPYFFRKQIQWKSVLFFGIPGMVGACIGGWGTYFVSGSSQLTLFGFAMLASSGAMLFGPLNMEKFFIFEKSIWMTIIEGFLIGCLTGFIGVGGGFLIVPALAFLCLLPLQFAIGTSLVIIAMNSLIGFFMQSIALKAMEMHVDWRLIAVIAMGGILGSFTAGIAAKNISQVRLRKVFGYGVLVMGFYVLSHSFI